MAVSDFVPAEVLVSWQVVAGSVRHQASGRSAHFGELVDAASKMELPKNVKLKDPEQFGNTYMSPWAYYKAPKKYFSGGAGLTSTITDYSRFAQMLLNGGELDGVRLLSPKTVESMATSHTEDIPGSEGGPGSGFGLGFRVVTDLGESQMNGSVGMYGWSGIYGTNFWVDPKEKLIAIMMVQKYPNPTVAGPFQTLTYQAIVGPPAPVPVRGIRSRPTSSTSAAPIFSPPRLMTSFRRPVSVR